MVAVNQYKKLEIWNLAMDICEDIYRETDTFPRRELYNLVSQMRRAAVSGPSNIAEGFVRKSAKEFRHFLMIALGSLAELETQIILSGRLEYLTENKTDKLLVKIEMLMRKTSNLHRTIRT